MKAMGATVVAFVESASTSIILLAFAKGYRYGVFVKQVAGSAGNAMPIQRKTVGRDNQMAKRRPSGDGMVRKRDDGRWEGRIVVGHKENGDSIFHYVSAKTQKALMEKMHRCIVEYDGAELTEDSRMTLGGVAGHLVEGVCRTVGPAIHIQGLPWVCRAKYQTLPWQQTNQQGDCCRCSDLVSKAAAGGRRGRRGAVSHHGPQDTRRPASGAECGC